LNPRAAVDAPCSCDFWPPRGFGRALLAARSRDFCSCLFLIM